MKEKCYYFESSLSVAFILKRCLNINGKRKIFDWNSEGEETWVISIRTDKMFSWTLCVNNVSNLFNKGYER